MSVLDDNPQATQSGKPDDRGAFHYAAREAVALFPDEAALESALLNLQEHGVDRARLSVLGHATAQDAAHRPDWVRSLADADHASHDAVVDRASRAEGETAIIAIPGYGGAMAGLIAVLATGGTLGLAVGAALLYGAVGSGAGGLLTRSIERRHREKIEAQLAAGGLILWVMIDKDEAKVLDLLNQAGGQHVHVTDNAKQWGPDDSPLAHINPDPILEPDP